MVGQKHQRKVFVFCRQSVYNRPDNVFINHFDAVNLAFGFSAVSTFVGCFHVDIAEIVCFKGFESGWMDLTGQWLYAESIFASSNDEMDNGFF